MKTIRNIIVFSMLLMFQYTSICTSSNDNSTYLLNEYIKRSTSILWVSPLNSFNRNHGVFKYHYRVIYDWMGMYDLSDDLLIEISTGSHHHKKHNKLDFYPENIIFYNINSSFGNGYDIIAMFPLEFIPFAWFDSTSKMKIVSDSLIDENDYICGIKVPDCSEDIKNIFPIDLELKTVFQSQCDTTKNVRVISFTGLSRYIEGRLHR